MKLLFKQRIFSWLDSYDVYDEGKNVLYTVKGILAFKHCFKIYDQTGSEVGMVRERFLTFLRPHFDLGCVVNRFVLYYANVKKGCRENGECIRTT